MQPYLIGQVQGSDGSVIQRTPPQQLSQPVSATIAGYERQMMIAAVQQPDGMGYQLNKITEGGLVIAGASGATRSAGSADDAFTAFAPADNPKIAVGVIIQGDAYGSGGTAMIAGAVVKAYLATLGAQ